MSQTAIPLRRKPLETLAQWLATHILNPDPAEWSDVTFSFLDDSDMAEANRTAFGRDYPTDVIAYRYDAIPGEAAGTAGGDVLVNAQCALARRPDRPDHELALYMAHGLHHLTGAEDDTPERRADMLAAESAWISAAEEAGLLHRGTLYPPPPPHDKP